MAKTDLETISEKETVSYEDAKKGLDYDFNLRTVSNGILATAASAVLSVGMFYAAYQINENISSEIKGFAIGFPWTLGMIGFFGTFVIPYQTIFKPGFKKLEENCRSEEN